MELNALTRTRLDEFLRLEAGVDVLAGHPPATRVVAFGRRTARLAARGRPRQPGEDWSEHLLELAYLARLLRPRGLAIAFAMHSSGPPAAPVGAVPARLDLHVLTVERTALGCRTEQHAHPFTVSDAGLLAWGRPTRVPVPDSLRALGGIVMRRTKRVRRHDPGLVAQMLVAEGHRIELAPERASGLTGTRPIG